MYYDGKRFKGQMNKKKGGDPGMIRQIEKKEREMAAHMEQIYKFDKKTEHQETTMYLEPA